MRPASTFRFVRLGSMLAAMVTSIVLSATGTAQAEPGPRDAVVTRFAGDADASKLALDLFDTDGDVVDVLPAERFDGGYRGVIQLVPALPVGPDRKHLGWVG